MMIIEAESLNGQIKIAFLVLRKIGSYFLKLTQI